MYSIDLNADIGEGCTDDEALIATVTSVNIACGAHAGDANLMRHCVRVARRCGVSIGAHPGYPDREYFGRRPLALSAAEVYASVCAQLTNLAEIAAAEGSKLVHVKPHGALYNQAGTSVQLADAIAAAVAAVDHRLALVGLAASELPRAATRAGLRAIHEGYADRRYQPDGTLVPREVCGAVFTDPAEAVEQVMELVQRDRVRVADGCWLALSVETICVHGDGPWALDFAQRIRLALQAGGIALTPLFNNVTYV